MKSLEIQILDHCSGLLHTVKVTLDAPTLPPQGMAIIFPRVRDVFDKLDDVRFGSMHVRNIEVEEAK